MQATCRYEALMNTLGIALKSDEKITHAKALMKRAMHIWVNVVGPQQRQLVFLVDVALLQPARVSATESLAFYDATVCMFALFMVWVDHPVAKHVSIEDQLDSASYCITRAQAVGVAACRSMCACVHVFVYVLVSIMWAACGRHIVSSIHVSCICVVLFMRV